MENPRNYVPHEKENRRGSTPISDSHPKECMQLKVGAKMIKDAQRQDEQMSAKKRLTWDSGSLHGPIPKSSGIDLVDTSP